MKTRMINHWQFIKRRLDFPVIIEASPSLTIAFCDAAHHFQAQSELAGSHSEVHSYSGIEIALS